MKLNVIAGACGIALAAALATACSSSPAPITAHGLTEDCTGTFGDGTPVAITNSSGTVVADATLTTDGSPAALAMVKQYDDLNALASALNGGATGMSAYNWTVTVPAGQARYGVTVGSATKGTIWFSEQQMRSGPATSLGC